MALSAARRPAGRRRGPLLLPSLLLSVPGACLLAAYFGPAFFAPAGKPQRPAVQRRLHNHRAAAVGVRSAIGEAPTQEEAVAVVPDGEEEASQASEEAVGAGADGGEEAGKKEEGRMLMVQDLQIGQELQGVVTKIIKMGAFVDVKAERPGLVPRNKLRSNFTANVADVVKVGDKVKVWVSEANGEKFILSMVKGKAYAPSTAKRAPINLLEPLAGAEDTWLDGTVARIQPWGAFVSVVPPGAEEGEQVQGLVHRKEIKAGGFKGSVEEEFAIGQAVRVRVLSVDTGASRAAFSMVDAADAGGAEEEEEQRQAEEDLYTADLGQFHDIAGLTDEWLTGRVVSASPIGVFVAVKGPDGGEDEARGFLHRSQIRDAFVEDASQEFEMGEEVKVRVAKVQLDQHKMFLTMLDKPAAPTKKKEPPSPQDAQRFAELVGGDQWLVGKVTAVTKFGAFVEVEHPSGEGKPVTGLVHLTEMSDAFVENIQDIVDVGQEARVRLIACDTASGKVSLSMKEPSSEKERPVADVAAFRDLPSDLWLTGTVTRLDNFGIFVEVPAPSGAADGGPPGVGLVHISQVADRFVEDVAEIAEVGQEVQVRVLEVDVDKGRLAFSMLDPEARKADEAEAEEESQQEEGTES